MAFTIYSSPGVYVQELDLSTRVRAIATTIGGIVHASKRGPVEPTFITERKEYLDLFGPPDPTVSFGHDVSLGFLSESNGLWVKRAINGALYGGLMYVNDVSGPNATKTYVEPFNEGASNDYNSGGPAVFHIALDDDLVALNEINIDINGSSVTTTFGTSHADTMNAWVTAIQNRLNAISLGGKATLLASPSGSAARMVRITAPYNTEILIDNESVTLGASQANVTIDQTTKLFDIFAHNPGSWINDIGVKIESIDAGVPQRQKLTFSSALVTANQFSVQINGVTIAPVSFDTDSDTTMANIASAISTALGSGASATVIAGAAGTNSDDRQIVIVAPDAKANFVLTNAIVTGGASQANVTVEESLTRIPPDNTFTISVYQRSNISLPIEKFTVSLIDQLDGFGRQQNIEQVINNSSFKSSYIRVKQYSGNSDGVPISTDNAIRYLASGDDGVAVTSSNIINDWESAFSDPDDRAVRILLNGGYTSVPVQQKMTAIAQDRRDCFAVLEVPSDQQEASSSVSFRRNDLNINSNYGALYAPDLNILDTNTDKNRFIPPSGLVGAAYARTDRMRQVWFAPAGLNTGQLYNINGLRHKYGKGHRNIMHPAQVNAIIQKPGKGFVIWDAETLQSNSSALSNINVRRLLIVIETALANALDDSLFVPNNTYYRFLVWQQMNDFLQPIKDGGGLYDFRVVCDERNNKAYDMDAGQMNVDVYLKPVIPAKYIRLRSIITKTGAVFEEEILAASGQ